MKPLLVIAMAIFAIFVNQVVYLEAALLPNEIKILSSSVKPGPKFGDGWSREQKEVWNKTQEWWQLRIVLDWKKIENLYHKDAIVYPYFCNVPLNFPKYKELARSMSFDSVNCTVREIRIIENVAIVMIYYEIYYPIPPKRMIFVWMKQGADWKLITSLNKEE